MVDSRRAVLTLSDHVIRYAIVFALYSVIAGCAQDDAPTQSIDTLCQALSLLRCGDGAQPCCAAAGLNYIGPGPGCYERAFAQCSADVTSVRDGRATYDPKKGAECLAAWREKNTICGGPREARRIYATCGAMFHGTLAAGTPCSEGVHAECSASPGTLGYCAPAQIRGPFVCGALSVPAAGESCPTKAGSEYMLTCDVGSYCATDTGAVCRPALALGAPCAGQHQHACGYGRHCDASGKCVLGWPIGSPCSQPVECASWLCADGKCRDTYWQYVGDAHEGCQRY